MINLTLTGPIQLNVFDQYSGVKMNRLEVSKETVVNWRMFSVLEAL